VNQSHRLAPDSYDRLPVVLLFAFVCFPGFDKIADGGVVAFFAGLVMALFDAIGV
jgi:hypothetical protein